MLSSRTSSLYFEKKLSSIDKEGWKDVQISSIHQSGVPIQPLIVAVAAAYFATCPIRSQSTSIEASKSP